WQERCGQLDAVNAKRRRRIVQLNQEVRELRSGSAGQLRKELSASRRDVKAARQNRDQWKARMQQQAEEECARRTRLEAAAEAAEDRLALATKQLVDATTALNQLSEVWSARL